MAYVPSGTNSFSLNDVSGFAVGDTIRLIRPVTDAWVHFNGNGPFGSRRQTSNLD